VHLLLTEATATVEVCTLDADAIPAAAAVAWVAVASPAKAEGRPVVEEGGLDAGSGTLRRTKVLGEAGFWLLSMFGKPLVSTL